MNILFIGDVVGKPGRRAVATLVPRLREERALDFVIANGENSAHGAGLTASTVDALLSSGVEVITSGDHVWDQKEIYEVIDREPRLLRPLNYPPPAPGRGSIVVPREGRPAVGVINLIGRVFLPNTDCPFRAAEAEVARIREQTNLIIVDLHAEATSEKIAMGRFLDGKVSAVIGTHTHVATADEQILPKGTAYISDVGMCGPHDSVLGRDVAAVLRRFLTQMPQRLEVAEDGVALCGVIVEVDEPSGPAPAPLNESVSRATKVSNGMILRARYVLPMDQPPIEDGAVAIDGDRVVAVGKTAEIRAAHTGQVRDLGDRVLAPGLINAHCHLDLTRLRGEVEWRGSFIEWALQLVAAKKLHSEKDYLSAYTMGSDQLIRSGTTTVVDITSTPAILHQILPTKLRVWWCLELIDFNRTDGAQALTREALEFIAAHPNVRGGFGLSPHAPYTASGELYRLCGQYARERNLPLVTHLAESQEEDDMIRRGTGAMYDYFLRAERNMGDFKRVGPTQLLSEYGVLNRHCLAAHANYLTPLDMALLKQSGAHVVVCPKTHRFFQRGTPLLSTLRDLGINVCLGTDSMASNDTLSMLEEMQTLAHMFPRMSAQHLLELATLCAAQALNQREKLGKIAPGAWADLIAAPVEGAGGDPYEAIVYADKTVSFSMVGGEVIFDEAK